MLFLSSKQNYFLYYGKADFRQGFNGLSGIVCNQMNLDPASGDIFVFINERRAREEEMDAGDILALRRLEAVPIMHRIKAWLDVHISQVVASTPIYEAISYTLKIWDRLMVYTTNGQLMPDTNLVENALRVTALGYA